jgi:hypothetical protein
MKGSEIMKKVIWGLLFILGMSFLVIGITRFDSSAAEAEMYMDLLLDVDDQEYQTPYSAATYGGYRQPLAFISLGTQVKEDILEKASFYGVEPANYVLAVTVSTYSEDYDFETVIQTIQDADEASLTTYLNELRAVLEENAEAIKTTLDEIKETHQTQIQDVKDTYIDQVKTLIREIRRMSDEAELEALNEELEALKAVIRAEVDVIQAAFVQELEDNNIAIEGLYGLFMRQVEDRFETRMAMFERRFPRLYRRVKNHFNQD